MRRIGCFLLAALLLAALVGCGGGDAAANEVLLGAFSYEIKGELGGVAVCGRVFADAPRESDGSQLRRVGIVFSSPDALCGITAVCDNFNPDTHETGDISVTLDGMTVDSAALDGLLCPALLLAAGFHDPSTATSRKNGITQTTITAQAHGSRRALTFTDGILTRFEGNFGNVSGAWEVLS